MGTLTLAQLRTRVSKAFASRTDVTDAEITTILNLMQERIARSRDWEELRFCEDIDATWTGVRAVDKFIDFTEFTTWPWKEIFSLRVITSDGKSAKIEFLPAQEFDKLIPEPEYWSADKPNWYTQWKSAFELWRVPDQSYKYTLRGIQWPPDLVNDTDTSLLDKKDDLLIWITISWLWNEKGEYQRGTRFFNMFSQVWEEASFEDHSKPDQTIKPAHQIRGFRASGDYWLNPMQTRMPR